MLEFLVCVTVLFFSRSVMGLSRLVEPPKRLVMYYNHKADMVDMVLNVIIFGWGLALVGAHFLQLSRGLV